MTSPIRTVVLGGRPLAGRVWLRVLLALGLMGWLGGAPALELSPDQLLMLQQLSPEQRSALMGQVQSGSTPSAPVTMPVTVQPRAVEAGKLETAVKSEDARDDKAVNDPDPEFLNKPESKGNVEAEVRRAFQAFVQESKPMEVSLEGLQQFGYELFAGQPTTFAPVTDVPVPPEYVLGPGDEIRVQLFGKDNRELVLTVDREGMVAFPQIGPIQLARLNFGEAKALLAEQIKQKMLGVSASITMGQLRSIRVFALGDVFKPGSYTVSGLATLSHALFASGGVKKIGSLRNVELKRNGQRVGTLDLYDFLLRGDTSKDRRLLPGDVVFVPPIGKTVSIAGKVIRPAIYEIRNENTLGDILKLAGGLLPDGYTSKALIERFSNKGDKRVINVELAGNGLKTPIRNGDVIKVFSATEFESNQVMLIGHIKRPGKYAWHEGMRVADLVRELDDLLPEAFLEYGIIEREAPDTREPTLTRFRLGDLLANTGGEANIALMPRDRVYVFSRSSFRQQPKISIAGSVQAPGQYEFKRDMHLADLVLAAGGLLRDTDMEEVEIYRTDPASRDVSLLKVNLARAMAGEKPDDLLLQDLDRVVVHSIYERKVRETVTIRGDVHRPDEVPLTQGMRVADLVYAGGSVKETAYLERAEVTRYKVVNGERRESEHLEVNLAAALSGDAQANILLQPYDVLTVRRISNWRGAETVEVLGEVVHPGSYPVEDGERLSILLRRVGGFTGDAYLNAAVFTRDSVREEQRRELEELTKRMEYEISLNEESAAKIRDDIVRTRQLSAVDASRRMLSQLKAAQATGRMVIELKDVEVLKGTPYDIQLRNGDRLMVPKKPDEVLVVGDVYNRSALLYDPDLSRDDYIAQAGPTRTADLDNVYVVRANGRIETGGGWFGLGSSALAPGDTIVVPPQLVSVSLLDSMLDWGRAMSQIAITLASMKVIGAFK